MIRSLMKQEVKANYKLYVIFLSIIAMYAVTLVAMYDPSLKDSLKSLEESMPVVLAAFGMQDMGTTLLDFIITYLYKFVLIVTPFIYSIVMCYRLLAKYVENGSLAYLLNSKHGRTKIVITQWVNLFLGLVVIGGCRCSNRHCDFSASIYTCPMMGCSLLPENGRWNWMPPV